MASRFVTVEDIRLGAIYRFCAGRPELDLASVISRKMGWSEAKAVQLAAHWLGTEQYRLPRLAAARAALEKRDE